MTDPPRGGRVTFSVSFELPPGAHAGDGAELRDDCHRERGAQPDHCTALDRSSIRVSRINNPRVPHA